MNTQEQNLIFSEFGRSAVDAISKQIDLFGEEFVNVQRVLATARKIQKVDSSTGMECMYESLNYEPFYYDNFQDLKNCIKKGGIDLNRKNIERMVNVGVEIPTEIKEMLLTNSK